MHDWYVNGLLDISNVRRVKHSRCFKIHIDLPVIVCDYSHQAILCMENHSRYWAFDTGFTLSNHSPSKIRTSPRFTLTNLGSWTHTVDNWSTQQGSTKL